MERNLTASELIRRFREDKPLSKEERERNRQKMGLGEKMWWENDDDPVRVSSSAPRFKSSEAIRPIRESFEDDFDFVPRSSLKKSDMLNLSSSFGSDRMLGLNRSLDRRSLDDRRFTRPEGIYRPDLSIDKFNSSLEGLLRGINADPLQQNTLGSTGLLGLNTEQLKLDGRKASESETITNQPIENLNSSLEALLKQLNVDRPQPEDVLTIPEIVNRLDLDFSNLLSRYEVKEKEVNEALAKEEKLREEGRVEERNKRLLDDFDHSNDLLEEIPRVKFSIPVDPTPTTSTAPTRLSSENDDVMRWNFTCDRELDAADTIYKQMRALRVKLMHNLRRDVVNGPNVPREERGESETKHYSEAEGSNMTIRMDPNVLLKTAREIDISLSATMTALHHRLPDSTEEIAEASSPIREVTRETILELPVETPKTQSIGVNTGEELDQDVSPRPVIKKSIELELESIDKILDSPSYPTIFGNYPTTVDPIREVHRNTHVSPTKKPRDISVAFNPKPTAPLEPIFPAQAPLPQHQNSPIVPPSSHMNRIAHIYSQPPPPSTAEYRSNTRPGMTMTSSDNYADTSFHPSLPHRPITIFPTSGTLKEKKNYLQQIQLLRENL